MTQRLYFFLGTIILTITAFSQKERCSYMCQLKDTNVYSATNYSGEELFKIHKGEYFLYDTINQAACFPNGHCGHIPPEVVSFNDTLPPFKMNYSKLSCHMLKGNELYQVAKRQHVALQKFIDSAINQSAIGLEKLLSFDGKASEHAGEVYSALLWRVIHFGLMKV